MSNTGLVQIIERMESQFEVALKGSANPIPADRFVRCLRTTINSNPELNGLDRQSVMTAIMKAAQDGLVIDGKEAAILPFGGKATYAPMAEGLKKLMRKHSNFADLDYDVVYQKEVDTGRFRYVKGSEKDFRHEPILFGDKGEPVGAYAYVTTKDGDIFIAVMEKEDIEKRLNKGKQSQMKKEFWKDFWCKTAIRALYKKAPNSGDEAGYLDGVFRADEIEHDADGVVHEPAPMPVQEKPQTRAAAAVKARAEASVREAAPKVEIVDAEVIPDDYTPPQYDDEEMPL